MFENVLYQNAADLLIEDIAKDTLPRSILFYGPSSSAKTTAALELARVLSCRGTPKGEWNCNCESCQRHKALVSQNTLLLGAGNRTLEIAAAKKSLLTQFLQNSSHLESSRYFYVRAVRKLTSRFSPVLWEGEDKLAKFSPLVQAVNENLELINPGKAFPEEEEFRRILDDIEKNCDKLESSFLYESLPVSQIRNFSSWAHLSAVHGKKVLIIENADRMQEGARNALLKILEEPPEDVLFILTTAKRSSILPTILSRVRTYSFVKRSQPEEEEVLKRVFHFIPSYNQTMPESIDSYLSSFLPVNLDTVAQSAADFFKDIAEGHVPDVASIVTSCKSFEPRMVFKIFLDGIIKAQKNLLHSPAGSVCSQGILKELKSSYNNVTVYNQNPAAALEMLSRNLMQINHLSGGAFREALH
ncbi:DNA polymerase III [Treponema sp.]|uniref:DNA polymerase III n=1 Tax=Treponema sp. TaxID=166 RepID=UPI0025E69496|nr:DNA polymerase III [Treponema sp.]MCR5218010.1 DNA polymerase III [Treponema sp.]